ncbi:saccharopine dehydrogenase C-terminal domain-containing protein [Ferruginibacter sp.]|nr:saccharopine dehydrogenase NADP-binding domain-containing protein [Ferruginibacter sp.]
MKTILLFGAGKSATILIDYLLQAVQENNWKFIIADADKNQVLSKTNNSPFAEAVQIDITKGEQRAALIQSADIVISMMPPALHFLVAQDCVAFGKNLLTASYVDDQIKTLQSAIDEKKLLFLCEMGLDPGIDHMSAMKMIDDIKSKGGTVTSFKSHCGGLIAPESDNNPWHYKISWNPRNIVLAGSAGAVYKAGNKVITTEYHQVFEHCDTISFPGLTELAWYPNRDSLSYIPTYKLESADTFIRTTLRYPAFCRGWDYIVNLGLTDTEDHDNIIDCETYADWLERKLYMVEDTEMSLEEYVDLYVHEDFNKEIMAQFNFLGLASNNKLPKAAQCSADILQFTAETKLAMLPQDKDMIVMLHEIEYTVEGLKSNVKSWLRVDGTDNLRTAMAKTVGLPLGIAAKLILNGTIQLTGLQIPTAKEIYEPVLKELETMGIRFTEKALP